MGHSSGTPAAELVAHLVDLVTSGNSRGVVSLLREWTTIVGADLGAHSRIVDIANGTIMVGVDHPAWLQRIEFRRTRILAELQRRNPELEIHRLHLIVVDDLGTLGDAAARARENRRTSGSADQQPTARPQRGSQEDSGNAPAARDQFEALLARLGEAIEENARDRDAGDAASGLKP